MIFPQNKLDLEEKVLWLVDKCFATREDRQRLYDWREKYYLFGTGGFQPAKYNRIAAHLDLVSSFLYAPDGAYYHIAAQHNSDDETVARAIALQDDYNDDFTDTFTAVAISEALDWSLVYDSMVIKQGWQRARGRWFCELVPPGNFGMYREDQKLEDQSCFAHSYFVEFQYAVEAMIRAGRYEDIDRLSVTHVPTLAPFPQMIQRMIIANTGGTNLAGNVLGQVNPDYAPMATYQAKTEPPGVQWTELYAWDDYAEDYRVFHVVDGMLVGDSQETIKLIRERSEEDYAKLWGFLSTDEAFKPSQTNFFLPGDHPFTIITPYPKYNYAWGISHLDRLVQLQEWLLERLDQIADILEKQAYPARSFTGMPGLIDEKAAAFGGADTWVLEQTPGGHVEEHAPTMPDDIFRDTDTLGQFFLEASGLTELVSGRGEKGVRSGAHAQQLKKTGSGRIKKVAERLKPSLVRIGDLGLRLKIMHDNSEIIDSNRKSFRAADIKGEVKMRVDGHEYSPLFSDEAIEKASVLFKSKVIGRQLFARLLKPSALDNVLHDAAKMDRQEAEMQALLAKHPELAGGKGHGGGRPARR